MPHELPQSFQEKYESLMGEVHLAADWGQAAQAILAICKESAATTIALAPLPEALTEALDPQWEQAGLEVLAPPFDHAELPQVIDTAQVGLSAADFAIAETGTLVEVTRDDAHRLVSSLPRTHIGVVLQSALIPTLEDAAPRLRGILTQNAQDCTVTFISGPSRTGDIEMILTLGVHGPEIAHAIIVENDHA